MTAHGPDIETHYVAVAIDVPIRRTFSYRLPAAIDAGSIRAGSRVMVPFGRGRRVGVIVDPNGTPDVAAEKIRPVAKLLDDAPIWSPALWSLLLWTADYYHHPIGEVIATAMPAALRQGPRSATRRAGWYALTECGRAELSALPASARTRGRLLRFLASSPAPLDAAALDAGFDKWRPMMRTLVRAGLVAVIEPSARHAAVAPSDTPPELSRGQQDAVAAIGTDLGRFRCVLLDGVTGSGKTEVYLRVLDEAIRQGRQALVLVPEIGLTAQTVDRITTRFGEARRCVLHSGLSDSERARAFDQARRGDVSIVIGTRSAIWTPLARPGAIIVDEEHDLSYKQQEGLRYSARDVAVMRARLESTPIILGSATPSLESLANATSGRYEHVVLPTRAGGASSPEIIVLDMRGRPLNAGISDVLMRELDETVANGHQALVFINRRGYAPSLLCHACGTVVQCRRCDARMIVHAGAGQLRCHHCGAQRPLPRHCEACAGAELVPVGQGTERVAGLLAKRYGEQRIVRIDRDSTRRRGALEQALAMAHSARAAILVGTQMLAKGHHFPGITLVAVVDADGQLFSVDLRASERLAQLLVQVAGRAGRGERAGRVIIQTHHPAHPLFAALRTGGYRAITEGLLAERRATRLPPFAFLAMLRAESTSPEVPLAFLDDVAATLRAIDGAAEVEVCGPLPAPMARRAGQFRAQLLIQGERRGALHEMLNTLLPRVEALPASRRVRWSIDVDPAELF